MSQEKVGLAAQVLGGEIESALVVLKEQNEVLHKQNNIFPPESFTNISGLFARLAKVSAELNIRYFHEFFQNMSDVAHYCTESENPKAHKKVAVIVLDFEKTLEGLQVALSDKEKLKLVKKTMELTDHKIDRLKRGEFFSLANDKKSQGA